MAKVQCSFESCFKTFKDQAAMVKHKVKEPGHEYCERCDVDCDDDMAYLIHQIQSAKHIACPICGTEFRSEGGRNAHVEKHHRKAQSLDCPGCCENFKQASHLMRHIEMDECNVISQEVHSRQLAEKQILKDTWVSALASNTSFSPSHGTQSQTTTSQADTKAGVSLLDDDQATGGRNWMQTSMPGSGKELLQPTRSHPFTTSRPAIQSLGALSLDKFPALANQNKSNALNQKYATSTEADDLLDLSQPEQRIQTQPKLAGAWSEPGTIADRIFSPAKSQVSNAATYDNSSQPPLMLEQESQSNYNQSSFTPYRQPLNPDPNAANVTVKITQRLDLISVLDPENFYDAIQQKYICTGVKCRRSYDTSEDFRGHLISAAHVGGTTVCPSCLSRFKSTAALISHCESASKKCNIRKSSNYNQILRELTGGLIGAEGHLSDGSVRYMANKVQDW